MNEITKQITYIPGAGKQPLFSFSSRYFFLSIIAFFIIAGTETYFRNRYGSPGTVYVMGYGSWVYAITWSILFFTARSGAKRLHSWLAKSGKEIVEVVTFSEDYLTVSSGDYYFGKYPWAYLSSFRETKRFLTLYFGTNLLMINKQYFTPEECQNVIALLNRKTTTPNQAMHQQPAAGK